MGTTLAGGAGGGVRSIGRGELEGGLEAGAELRTRGGGIFETAISSPLSILCSVLSDARACADGAEIVPCQLLWRGASNDRWSGRGGEAPIH
jgi:hypothetical protein